MDQERQQQGLKVPGYLKALTLRTQQGKGKQGDGSDAAGTDNEQGNCTDEAEDN